MKLCQKCGAEVGGDASYCENCGISLEEYPAVEAGDEVEDSGETKPSPGPKGMNPGTRRNLIVLFVAFDILVAVFLIYILTQVD